MGTTSKAEPQEARAWRTVFRFPVVDSRSQKTYLYRCFQVASEFRFTLGASQRAYLGDFRLEGLSIHVLNQLDTDVAYFRSHTIDRDTTNFKLLPMQMKRVIGACANRSGPPINGYLPAY